MMKVNLDALIRREDFELITDGEESQVLNTISIGDLSPRSFFRPVLRKPDFQRETADWSPEKVANFLESFINGDLIPAVILWASGRNNFIIDGSHRLSALLAWVYDDYGDGEISQKFFGFQISAEQKRAAELARKLVHEKVGSYQDLQEATRDLQEMIQSDPQAVISNSPRLTRASRLGRVAITLQWVRGNAAKAEESFYKINQSASPVDKHELRLIQGRRNPSSIAARAILHAGAGHKYWSDFEFSIQKEIEAIASEINKLLFEPVYETPIKTPDLPLAGKKESSGVLGMVLDLINLTNEVSDESEEKNYSGSNENSGRDQDGTLTIQFLNKTKRILQRMTGNHPSSLGLHPIVYFYSYSGKPQLTALLAMALFLMRLEKEHKFDEFILVRRSFEAFFIRFKDIPNQVFGKFKQGNRSASQKLAELYSLVFDLIYEGKAEDDIKNALANSSFKFVNLKELFEESANGSFSSKAKSAIFMKEALKLPLRCAICGGLMHSQSMNVDHINRKRDGGLGSFENGQLTHLYCNSTYKN